MIKFEVPEDGQSVYEIRTKSGQSSVGLRICRGTAGLDEAHEIADLLSEFLNQIVDSFLARPGKATELIQRDLARKKKR